MLALAAAPVGRDGGGLSARRPSRQAPLLAARRKTRSENRVTKRVVRTKRPAMNLATNSYFFWFSYPQPGRRQGFV